MNIIVSTHDSLYPLQGGGALRTLTAARDFKNKGHNVIIIAPADNKSEIDGIKIHWLHPPRKQRSQILSSFKFNVRLLRKFLCFVKEADIFFVHNTISAATMPFLKKFFKFKFVLDITDIHAEYLPIGKRDIFERALTPYLIAYEYWIIKSADSVIAASEAMKNLLIKKGINRDKIKVVYDGVNNRYFQARKNPGSEISIIHLGAIDRQHGVELLVRAAVL
ncbi:MAG: glycosyltransferase, partial [Candidatus Omnitrophica bacterium]|nr:glycosyltransferase [Candidatus Omnitrophota bacterium]